MWLSADPLSGYNPVMETEHYIDGQHNGGVFNSFNLNTYGYCYQNPVNYIDPNGKQIFLGGTAVPYMAPVLKPTLAMPRVVPIPINPTIPVIPLVPQAPTLPQIKKEGTKWGVRGTGAKHLDLSKGVDWTQRDAKVDKAGDTDSRTSNDALRRNERTKLPEPDPEAQGTKHTQLGTKKGSKGNYRQAREFNENNKPVRDIDFTDHGRPQNHPNPHQHKYEPNPTGGTMQRGKKAQPLD